MKPYKFIFTLLTLFVFTFQNLSQNAPCYKRKKICNYQYLTNCYEKVAFDSASNRYYSRQSLGTLFDGTCSTPRLNLGPLWGVQGSWDDLTTAGTPAGFLNSKAGATRLFYGERF